MSKQFALSAGKFVLAIGLVFASTLPSPAQDSGKILGGYFEEWSIYYAGYNIANLQQNGVADNLTHLMYAFANVTTTPAPGLRDRRQLGRLSDAVSSFRQRSFLHRAALWQFRARSSSSSSFIRSSRC